MGRSSWGIGSSVAVVIAAADLGLGELGTEVVFCLVCSVQDALRDAAEHLLDQSAVDPWAVAFDGFRVLGIASGKDKGKL